MFVIEITTDPVDQVVFEGSFYELMQNIRRYKFVDVCARKFFCKWL